MALVVCTTCRGCLQDCKQYNVFKTRECETWKIRNVLSYKFDKNKTHAGRGY